MRRLLMDGVIAAINARNSLYNGLTHYWKFEETTGNRVDLIGGNNLVPHGTTAPTSTAGKNGNAVLFDGSQAQYLDGAGIPLNTGSWTIACWVNFTNITGTQVFISENAGTGGTIDYEIWKYSDGQILAYLNATISAGSYTTVGANNIHCVVASYDAVGKRLYIHLDNNTHSADASSVTPRVSAGATFRVGKSLTSGYMTGWIDELAIWNRCLTAAEKTSWYNDGVGLFPPFSSATSWNETKLLPADLSDNGYSDIHVAPDVYFCSSFSRAVFTTDAPAIKIKVFSDYANNQAYDYNVIVDGVQKVAITPTALDYNSDVVVNLFSNSTKTVQIVSSTINALSRAAAGVYEPLCTGVFLYSVSVPAGYTFSIVTPTRPANRMVIYGDSIAVGGGATYPCYQGWGVLMRAYIPVAFEAWSVRELYEANTPTKRTALAAQIASFAPATVWLAIGTNDYGLSYWNATDFGTAYADLLDKLHAALPSAAIYAQTPIARTTETANSQGNTLPDYRAAIGTAVSTRAWSTLVDGTAWTIALADGLHPNAAGHAAYAAAVKTVLGV